MSTGTSVNAFRQSHKELRCRDATPICFHNTDSCGHASLRTLCMHSTMAEESPDPQGGPFSIALSAKWTPRRYCHLESERVELIRRAAPTSLPSL